MNDETRAFTTLKSLRFYSSPVHTCSYLMDRDATTLFVDPEISMNMDTYHILSLVGFRRSGDFVYRPHCIDCHLCIPVRLRVNEFKPNRSQRRCWNKNQDLELNIKPATFEKDHFKLYRKYMQARHPGGGMDNDDPEAYFRVMTAEWSDTSLFEFCLNGEIIAVAVVDIQPDSFSAVYTFFSPDFHSRSLGVYAVLTLIEQAKASGHEWVYLGYWNPDSEKMTYKNQYQPLEYFDGADWRDTSPV